MDTNSIIYTESCVKDKENVYFISRDTNILCVINIQSCQIDILSSIPDEDFFQTRLGAKLCIWNNKLILAPMNAKKIWIYDLKGKTWDGIEIKDYGEKYRNVKFFRIILIDNWLYFIGTSYPAIIVLDLLNGVLTYHEEMYAALLEKREKIIDGFFRDDYVRINDDIYMASCLDNKVLKMHLKAFEWEWIAVGSSENRYSGIGYDGKNYWLSPRNNNIITKWDGKSEVSTIEIPDEYMDEPKSFLGVVCQKDKILFPRNGKNGSLIIKNEKIQSVHNSYVFYDLLEDGSCAYQDMSGLLTIEGNNRLSVKLEINRHMRSKYLAHTDILLKDKPLDGIFYENEKIDLSMFMAALNKMNG